MMNCKVRIKSIWGLELVTLLHWSSLWTIMPSSGHNHPSKLDVTILTVHDKD